MRENASTPSSSATRATSTCPRRGPRPAGRSCSTRSSRSTRPWWSTGAASDPAPRRRASSTDSTGTRSGRRISWSRTRPRTPLTSPDSGNWRPTASRSASWVPRSASSSRCGGAPPRFEALFVGKLIPLHGLDTILAAARLAPEIPFRVVGSGQLDALLSASGRRTSSGSGGSHTSSCPRSSPERGARSDLRHLGEGRQRDPEQGLPGAGLRHAARHRGHAGGARAPAGRGERPARPPGDPAALAAAIRRLATEPGLAERIGAAASPRSSSRPASRCWARRWRGLVEALVRP